MLVAFIDSNLYVIPTKPGRSFKVETRNNEGEIGYKLFSDIFLAQIQSP